MQPNPPLSHHSLSILTTQGQQLELQPHGGNPEGLERLFFPELAVKEQKCHFQLEPYKRAQTGAVHQPGLEGKREQTENSFAGGRKQLEVPGKS